MTDDSAATLKLMQNRPYRGWVLGLFVMITIFGFADRQIVSVLGQPIKRDLGLTDTEFGWLSGFAFALLNSLLAVPIARLADRGRRVTLVGVGVMIWTLATAACGLAHGFVQLLVSRLFVGLGEATGAPATASIIADYYPREKRTSAMGVFSLAIPLGSMLGFTGGGYIAQHYDWRTAFLLAGAPGLLLALLLFLTVREPLRGHYDPPPATQTDTPPPFIDVLRRILEKPAFLHTLLGSTLVSVGGFGIISFNAQFFFRRFGLNYAEAGLLTGLITSVPACLCILAAGIMADRLGRKDARFYGWVPALGAFLAAPFYIIAFLQHGWVATVVMLTVTGLVQYAYLPVSNGVYANLMEPRMRASATAVVGMCTNLVSAGLGPLLVGMLSDAFAAHVFAQAGGQSFSIACAHGRAAETASAGACGQASATGLTWACIVFALMYVWGGVHFMLAARTLRRDMAEDPPEDAAAA